MIHEAVQLVQAERPEHVALLPRCGDGDALVHRLEGLDSDSPGEVGGPKVPLDLARFRFTLGGLRGLLARR